MIRAGIIGGAGYTAGELIRILMHHPEVEIDFVYSTSNAGNSMESIHGDLVGEGLPLFTDSVNPNVDVVFLCLGHGKSTSFLKENKFSGHTRVIDLSNDFRLSGQNSYQGRDFVYGLPELNREAIRQAGNIANPGCFATAVQLALLPLAKAAQLRGDVHVNAVTGATGAGVSLSKTTHFTWRDNNFSHYKAFTHQHLGEINQSVSRLQPGFEGEVLFIPNRGNFSRGIFCTAYTEFSGSEQEALELYNSYYADAAFTKVSPREIFMKQVVNTNKCLVHLQKNGRQLLITTAIDNLLKGASGQAVQNMNLMYGLSESEGLQLKANYF